MKSNTFLDSGGARGSVLCRQLAHGVLDDYTKRLISMVKNAPHGVSVAAIYDFLDRYKEEQVAEKNPLYKQAYQSCLTRHEQEVFGLTRREPFKRILTLSFSHLFPPKGKMDREGTYISRRVLPGLFIVLKKMAGEGPFTQGRTTCMDIIQTLETDDGAIIWEDLYGHERALEAVDDLLMELVPHFEKAMNRIAWMVDLVNHDLGDPDAYEFEGSANRTWTLDQRNAIRILSCLFSHLYKRLCDKSQAQALAVRYGAKRARALVALVRALDP